MYRPCSVTKLLLSIDNAAEAGQYPSLWAQLDYFHILRCSVAGGCVSICIGERRGMFKTTVISTLRR